VSRWVIAVGALCLVVALGGFTWRCAWRDVRLASAHAATPPVGEKEPSRVRADGRIVARPGASVTLSAEILATVDKVLVTEGQRVHRGDLLLGFRRSEQQAALGEAEAAAAEAYAHLKNRASDARRTKTLTTDGALAPHELDVAKEEQVVARARLVAANATVGRLRAGLHKTGVVAPFDGVVVSRTVEPGETVTAGTHLFVLVDPDRLRVEAEVDEFDVGHVALNAEATISAEGFPGSAWEGTVEEVPDLVVSRKLRPLDPARTTDSGVLLAKIALPANTGLRLGQRVQVAISTSPKHEVASN
jgi:RND family efflux transporter MFP subunit